MPYLISVLAAAAGVVVLLTLLTRLAGPARRLAGTVHRSRAHWVDRTGLLAARTAALRVQLDRRRHRNWRNSGQLPPIIGRVASIPHPRHERGPAMGIPSGLGNSGAATALSADGEEW
ncbi:MAG: hypothetical protein JO309_07965 [Pseudonocardiales bacterium]|nr:hypothetical protein [Pseudonocardiales bacterium]MBV9729323.1 hypothetical protein [Pseudonocardiales bacterium]